MLNSSHFCRLLQHLPHQTMPCQQVRSNCKQMQSFSITCIYFANKHVCRRQIHTIRQQTYGVFAKCALLPHKNRRQTLFTSHRVLARWVLLLHKNYIFHIRFSHYLLHENYFFCLNFHNIPCKKVTSSVYIFTISIANNNLFRI